MTTLWDCQIRCILLQSCFHFSPLLQQIWLHDTPLEILWTEELRNACLFYVLLTRPPKTAFCNPLSHSQNTQGPLWACLASIFKFRAQDPIKHRGGGLAPTCWEATCLAWNYSNNDKVWSISLMESSLQPCRWHPCSPVHKESVSYPVDFSMWPKESIHILKIFPNSSYKRVLKGM